MSRPLDEGEGHLIHFREQLHEHVKEFQAIDPQEFADMILAAPPVEQAIMVEELRKLHQEATRLIDDIDEMRNSPDWGPE